MNVGEESWERFGHFPKPLTPLYISYLLPTVERGHARMFEEYSLLAKGLGFRAYKGRIYVTLKPPTKWLRRPPPESLMWVWRFLPSIRRRVKNCILHVQHGKPWQMLQLWKGEWIHQVQKELGDLKRIELKDLSDEDLIRHLDDVVELSREYFSMHVVLHGATAFSLGEFSSLAKRLLNWDDVKVYKAFTGLPGKSFEASKKLAEIAKVLTSESELKDVLWNSSPKEVLDRMLDSQYVAGVMLKEYLGEYGWRLTSLAYDFAEPTFLERPELIVDALKDYLEHYYDVYGKLQWLRTEREKFVASALNEIHSESDRRSFVEALKKAEEAYRVTDENNHYLVLVTLGILRYVILELGRRLRERDCIPVEGDVFYLTLDEIRKALTKPRNLSGLVEDRAKEFDDYGTEEPPQTIGKPMEFPKLRSFPKIVQQVHAYMVDYFDKLVRPTMSSEPSALELRGQVTSKGFYSGRAVVVHSENEFRKVMHGDVFVCPSPPLRGQFCCQG